MWNGPITDDKTTNPSEFARQIFEEYHRVFTPPTEFLPVDLDIYEHMSSLNNLKQFQDARKSIDKLFENISMLDIGDHLLTYISFLAGYRLYQGLEWIQLRGQVYLTKPLGQNGFQATVRHIRKTKRELLRIPPCPNCGIRDFHGDREIPCKRIIKPDYYAQQGINFELHRINNYSFKRDSFFKEYRQKLALRKQSCNSQMNLHRLRLLNHN